MEYVFLGLQFGHDEQLLTYLETVFVTNSQRFDLSARDLGHVMTLLLLPKEQQSLSQRVQLDS